VLHRHILRCLFAHLHVYVFPFAGWAVRCTLVPLRTLRLRCRCRLLRCVTVVCVAHCDSFTFPHGRCLYVTTFDCRIRLRCVYRVTLPLQSVYYIPVALRLRCSRIHSIYVHATRVAFHAVTVYVTLRCSAGDCSADQFLATLGGLPPPHYIAFYVSAICSLCGACLRSRCSYILRVISGALIAATFVVDLVPLRYTFTISFSAFGARSRSYHHVHCVAITHLV